MRLTLMAGALLAGLAASSDLDAELLPISAASPAHRQPAGEANPERAAADQPRLEPPRNRESDSDRGAGPCQVDAASDSADSIDREGGGGGDHTDSKADSDATAERATESRTEPAASASEPSQGGGWQEVNDPTLTADMQKLKRDIRQTLAYYFFRPENSTERSPWGVMHCIIGFGVDTPLLVNGEQINAISWLCYNGPCYGMRLLYEDRGRVAARRGPGYQGHDGQLLSILALSRVKIDYPLVVGGRTLSVADLVEHEKRTCEGGSELSFKLIGLSHYLDSDATWEDRYGRPWSIERLLKEEIEQPIVGASCGGTHRLIGLTHAVYRRKKEGKPVTGQWARADKYIADFHVYTFKLQNPDGSFSTRWFERRENSPDIDRQLNTSGHILEWLLLSLPQDRLLESDLLSAVRFVVDLMWNHREHSWEIGPRGHALHALALYDQRVFGGRLGNREQELSLVLTDGVTSQTGVRAQAAKAGVEEPGEAVADSPGRRRMRRLAR